jgi:5-hydroxyisourate hydrolase
MSPITTHVLDVSVGRPAAGVAVSLQRLGEGGFAELAEGSTNHDGRVVDLLAPGTLQVGTYRLAFNTGEYFARTARATFYPFVHIVFEVVAPGEHHHVPLLLSPFGYSTYRGS